MTRSLPSETACQAKAPEATGSPPPGLQKLYIETPCIPSPALSRAAGCNIFLKLENLQPSGSFKSRGIGTMMYRAMMRADAKDSNGSSDGSSPVPANGSANGSGSGVHFYCSSGGNAGLACATAAAALGRPCTIVVPMTTSARVVAQLRLLGAAVHQVGADWSVADRFLREDLLASGSGAGAGVYVPPFDHPDIWDGVSTLVDELCAQMPALVSSSPPSSPPFDAIVCNVGGGGLFNGIMSGVSRHFPSPASSASPSPSASPVVLALETAGADSLAASVAAGALVTLPRISSVATSLGAPRVSARSLEWSRDARFAHAVVPDAAAVRAAARFADDARLLVEVACGATLAAAYEDGGALLRRALGFGKREEDGGEWGRKNVVLVVCGGNNISLEMLRGYVEKFGAVGDEGANGAAGVDR